MDKTKTMQEIIDYCKHEENYSYYDMKAYAFKNKPDWIDALTDRSFRATIATYLKSAQRMSGKKYRTPLYEAMDNCLSAGAEFYHNKIESEKVDWDDYVEYRSVQKST